jgi:hypothetical protein
MTIIKWVVYSSYWFSRDNVLFHFKIWLTCEYSVLVEGGAALKTTNRVLSINTLTTLKTKDMNPHPQKLSIYWY